MNCKKAEIYMDALLDDELEVSESIDIVEHIEICSECRAKWELNEETRSKLKHFIGSIKASQNLKQNIRKNLFLKNSNVIKFRPSLIAACMIILLGLGFIYNESSSKVPPLNELHNNCNIEVISNNIEVLSNHIGVNLKDNQFSTLEKNDFRFQGASRVGSPFIKRGSIISLKNSQGNKISICFLPENYQMPECHKTLKNGIVFHCGYKEDCNYTYWKQNGKTIALVSNNFPPDQLIDMAESLTDEI